MKYLIININDRHYKNIRSINKLLSSFEYIEEIDYVDGRVVDAKKYLDDNGVSTDKWNPYDEYRKGSPPLPGEYGIFATNINIFKYVIDNKIDMILSFEDDAQLSHDFIKRFNMCVKDLPKDFDFLSLHYSKEHDKNNNNFTKESYCGSNIIHRSINQFSSNVAMLYSLNGCKKIMSYLKKNGMEYNIDCMLYKMSRDEYLNGFSIIPRRINLVSHDRTKIKSIIDPNGIR